MRGPGDSRGRPNRVGMCCGGVIAWLAGELVSKVVQRGCGSDLGFHPQQGTVLRGLSHPGIAWTFGEHAARTARPARARPLGRAQQAGSARTPQASRPLNQLIDAAADGALEYGRHGRSIGVEVLWGKRQC